MIKVINTLYIEKGKAKEVIERFKIEKTIHTFEGFKLMEVMNKEGTEDHDEVQICTTWEDKKSFDAWKTSKEFHDAHVPLMQREKSGNSPITSHDVTFFTINVRRHPVKKIEV